MHQPEPENPYSEYHSRLADVLILMALYWSIAFGWLLLEVTNVVGWWILLSVALLVVGFQLALAWGCARRLNLARRLAVLWGVILFMGLLIGPFPVGGFLVIYYLRFAQWEPTPPYTPSEITQPEQKASHKVDASA